VVASKKKHLKSTFFSHKVSCPWITTVN